MSSFLAVYSKTPPSSSSLPSPLFQPSQSALKTDMTFSLHIHTTFEFFLSPPPPRLVINTLLCLISVSRSVVFSLVGQFGLFFFFAPFHPLPPAYASLCFPQVHTYLHIRISSFSFSSVYIFFCTYCICNNMHTYIHTSSISFFFVREMIQF